MTLIYLKFIILSQLIFLKKTRANLLTAVDLKDSRYFTNNGTKLLLNITNNRQKHGANKEQINGKFSNEFGDSSKLSLSNVPCPKCSSYTECPDCALSKTNSFCPKCPIRKSNKVINLSSTSKHLSQNKFPRSILKERLLKKRFFDKLSRTKPKRQIKWSDVISKKINKEKEMKKTELKNNKALNKRFQHHKVPVLKNNRINSLKSQNYRPDLHNFRAEFVKNVNWTPTSSQFAEKMGTLFPGNLLHFDDLRISKDAANNFKNSKIRRKINVLSNKFSIFDKNKVPVFSSESRTPNTVFRTPNNIFFSSEDITFKDMPTRTVEIIKKPPILILEQIPVHIPLTSASTENIDENLNSRIKKFEKNSQFLTEIEKLNFNESIKNSENLPKDSFNSNFINLFNEKESKLFSDETGNSRSKLNTKEIDSEMIKIYDQLLHALALETATKNENFAKMISLAEATINNRKIAQIFEIQAAIAQQALLEQSFINERLKEKILEEREVNKKNEQFIRSVSKDGLQKAIKNEIYRDNPVHRIKTDNDLKFKQPMTKETIIQRLNLLRPYFLVSTSGEGGFKLPDSVPNVADAKQIHLSHVETLPKIKLPKIKSMGPEVELNVLETKELGSRVDTTFLQFLLRLPEHVFTTIIHLSKKEVILNLFPRIYREALQEFKAAKQKQSFSSHSLEQNHDRSLTIPLSQNPENRINQPLEHPLSNNFEHTKQNLEDIYLMIDRMDQNREFESHNENRFQSDFHIHMDNPHDFNGFHENKAHDNLFHEREQQFKVQFGTPWRHEFVKPTENQNTLKENAYNQNNRHNHDYNENSQNLYQNTKYLPENNGNSDKNYHDFDENIHSVHENSHSFKENNFDSYENNHLADEEKLYQNKPKNIVLKYLPDTTVVNLQYENRHKNTIPASNWDVSRDLKSSHFENTVHKDDYLHFSQENPRFRNHPIKFDYADSDGRIIENIHFYKKSTNHPATKYKSYSYEQFDEKEAENHRNGELLELNENIKGKNLDYRVIVREPTRSREFFNENSHFNIIHENLNEIKDNETNAENIAEYKKNYLKKDKSNVHFDNNSIKPDTIHHKSRFVNTGVANEIESHWIKEPRSLETSVTDLNTNKKIYPSIRNFQKHNSIYDNDNRIPFTAPVKGKIKSAGFPTDLFKSSSLYGVRPVFNKKLSEQERVLNHNNHDSYHFEQDSKHTNYLEHNSNHKNYLENFSRNKNYLNFHFDRQNDDKFPAGAVPQIWQAPLKLHRIYPTPPGKERFNDIEIDKDIYASELNLNGNVNKKYLETEYDFALQTLPTNHHNSVGIETAVDSGGKKSRTIIQPDARVQFQSHQLKSYDNPALQLRKQIDKSQNFKIFAMRPDDKKLETKTIRYNKENPTNQARFKYNTSLKPSSYNQHFQTEPKNELEKQKSEYLITQLTPDSLESKFIRDLFENHVDGKNFQLNHAGSTPKLKFEQYDAKISNKLKTDQKAKENKINFIPYTEREFQYLQENPKTSKIHQTETKYKDKNNGMIIEQINKMEKTYENRRSEEENEILKENTEGKRTKFNQTNESYSNINYKKYPMEIYENNNQSEKNENQEKILKKTVIPIYEHESALENELNTKKNNGNLNNEIKQDPKNGKAYIEMTPLMNYEQYHHDKLKIGI